MQSSIKTKNVYSWINPFDLIQHSYNSGKITFNKYSIFSFTGISNILSMDISSGRYSRHTP